MGQAKKRGTLEERVKKAKENSNFGENITIEEAIKRLDLPQDAEFEGYVIHLPEKDEFVHETLSKNGLFTATYAAIPDLAKRYDSAEEAVEAAKEIEKYKLYVCILFSTEKQYVIREIWANFDDEHKTD